MTPQERAWYPVLRYVAPGIEWGMRLAWRVLWAWRRRA